jgi:sRNA-binding carbon storage regulator CsrA
MGLGVTRKRGQRVRIQLGEVTIWVTVTDVKGNKASLDISAPLEFKVLREELIKPGE